MSFALTVGTSPHASPYRVTYNVYNLVSVVLNREFDFAQLIRMFTLAEARFDPADLLGEAEMLADMARAVSRPYVEFGRPLELLDLEGMLNFPHLLPHGGQVVTDWTEIVQLGDDPAETGIVSMPPTLIAGRERLFLVDAVAVQAAGLEDWKQLPHVPAKEFRWEAGQLLADGVPILDVPNEYLRPPSRRWTHAAYTTVPVYEAWRDEIESLIDACREGIKTGQPVVSRT